MNRKIKVYLPKGTQRLQTIETDAETWGALKLVLEAEGIDLNNTKALVGGSQVTLESEDAKLPVGVNGADATNGDFTLFLTPVKVKSGADWDTMEYPQLRSSIRDIIQDNAGAKDFFNNECKKFDKDNYTHCTVAQLRELLNAWSAIHESPEALQEASEELAEQVQANDVIEQVLHHLRQATVILQTATANKMFDVVDTELEELEAEYQKLREVVPGLV